MYRYVVLMLSVVGASAGAVRAYAIDPVKASWSGWTGFQDTVSQVVRCCWDHLDSVTGGHVELFTGSPGAGGTYDLEIREAGNGPTVARQVNRASGPDHAWLRFGSISMMPGEAFTKGKQYEFRFTRSGSDSIQYYWSEAADGGPYRYGEMATGNSVYLNADVCARVYGVMDTVSAADFGATCLLTRWDPDSSYAWNQARRDTWTSRANEAGFGWGVIFAEWNVLWDSLGDRCDFYDFDAHLWEVTRQCTAANPQPVVCLLNCAKWASSRDTLVWRRDPQRSDSGYWVRDTSIHCAPRNMWDPDSNYWEMYLDSLLLHRDRDSIRGPWYPCDSVHVWEVENEVNDSFTDWYGGPVGVTGWWRRPNRCYDPDSFPGAEGLCRLYVRKALLAADRIRSCTLHAGIHSADKILIGSVHRVRADTSSPWLISGTEWVRMCYEVATESGGPGIFWDGVSVHPYQEEHNGFSAAKLEAAAESIRAVMRHYGDHDGELWSTEVGWNSIAYQNHTQEQDVRNVCEVFATAKATEVLPQGGYDKTCWWVFYRWTGFGCWGLVESSLVWQEPFYAFKQARQRLAGKRFNGRVLTGDAETDSAVRILEFEDPGDRYRRTWVAWMNDTMGHGSGSQTGVHIPARAETLDSTRVADDESPPTGSRSAEADGWFVTTLTPWPVYVTEVDSIKRPDLVVDSVRYQPASPPQQAGLYAYVRNIGNDSTGTGIPELGQPNTVVRFYDNDSLLGHIDCSTNIPADDTITIEFGPLTWNPAGAIGGLLKATVNETQAYVELGMDDNAAYRRY